MESKTRVALVTGAAQGIGKAVAIALGAAGYAVALNDLRPAEDTRAQLTALGAASVIVAGDVAHESQVKRIVDESVASLGPIDVLVNNAGISLQRPAEETALAEWERVIAVNLTGPFLLCREAGRLMLARRSGAIINIASIAGLLGFGDRVAYNTSKHGLIGLTRTLAVEWGGRGVRVNAVCPGWVKTEMDTLDQTSAGYTDADITNRIPMARFATPEDIARAVLFLADAADFVNGQCLAIDGGWSVDGSWESLRLAHR